MQIVFDFIAGDVAFEDFWRAFEKDPSIGQWLDSIGDFKEEKPQKYPRDSHLQLLYGVIRNVYDGHVLKLMEINNHPDPETHHYSAFEKYTMFESVAATVLTAYPDARCTRMYKQDYDFFEKAVSQSMGGKEVETYIEQIMQQFPRTMKAADRVKAGRAAIQEAFHIHDRKFPCWPQEPDWPMGKNSPMEYLGRHKDGELVHLRFRDVDTGEERTVEQYY